MSIEKINAQIKAELSGNISDELGITESDDGPLWYRGLASNEEGAEANHVAAVLQAYGVDRIILGHTLGYGIILPRIAGRVIVVDAGIAEYYGGHIASLLIEDTSAFAVQSQHQLLLPITEDGILPYLQRAAALNTPTAALVRLIESLK